MHKRTIYAAGPMSGLTVGEIKARYSQVMIDLTPRYNVLHPMIDHENFETTTKRPDFVVEANGAEKQIQRSFFGRDKWMVRQADIVLADWSQASVSGRVSIGTVAEVSWAHAWNKYVVSVLPEGEGNPHEHAFIYMLSDTIFKTYAEAAIYLLKLPTGAF